MRQLKIEKTLTNRDSKAIKGYFNDISSIPMIDPETEVELAIKIQNGDEKALNRLVTSNLRFVVSVAKQYQNIGLDFEDLVSEGNLGLVKAAKNFDHTKGFKFISYAVWWIRAYITKAIEKKGKTIRLPVHHQQKAKQISLLQAKYLAKNGIEKNIEDIYDELDMSEKVKSGFEQVDKIKNINSLNSNLKNDPTDELVDITEDKNSINPINELERKDLKTKLLEAVANLNSRERYVISNLYNIGIKNQISAHSISKELSISYNTVIDIRNRALRKLARLKIVKEFRYNM